MLNLQDQSGRPKTVLREPCTVSHDEETLLVSTTAYVEKNISTQESMFHSNSVQEPETAITTLVENHQTDAAATGSASTILSTMSSMKLCDIMDKMTSCLFGWSWRRVSVFDLTGKNTDAENLTVCIPCTDIVLVTVQELFFPCSLMEDTNSYNQGVEEFMAIPSQPSLAKLCLRLAVIYDITACLSVVFRPECIVHVDCSVENFEAIADRMRDIGLPLPIRSPDSTLAIMSHQYSTVQEDQTVECDSREMALSLLEDTTGCNQVQVIQSMVIETQPSTAELELCLQPPGVGDITDNLRVVFRPECIVQVDCSMVNFEAIADHMRDIGVRLPTRLTDSTLAIMSPQSLTVEEVLTSEVVQLVDCDNYEMVLVVPQEAMQLINQEAVEHSSLPVLTAVEEGKTVDIDEICSLFAPMSGHNTKQPSIKSASKVLKGSEIFFGKAVVPHAFEEQNHVQDIRQGNTASTPNEVQVIESLTVQCQLSTAELELRLQLPEVCNITAHLRVVFRPECIVQVDLSILRFETIGDDIREIDLQLPMDAIASALGIMSPHSIALQNVVTSEDYPAEQSSMLVLPAAEKAESIDIEKVRPLHAAITGHNLSKTKTSKDVAIMKKSEIFFGKTIRKEQENDIQDQRDTSSSNNEVQVLQSMVVQSRPNVTELELRLQLPGVCDITGRLRVVFRPESIVQIDFSILRFEALGDDIREIDLQLPIDAIANALATVSSQPIPVQEVTTSEVQPVEHSSIPAQPPEGKAKTLDIKEFYSLLASMSSHAEESSHDVHELKGSAILCELETAPSREELEDIVAIEPAEVLKPLDNANNLENAACKKATITAQRDLQLKEPVTAVPIVPTEGIELQHVVILGLQEVSIEKQPTADQTFSEITVSLPSAQEVQASCSVNTVYQAIQTEHVHPTSNVLEEVVAREIREIRETVDNTVGGILDVPLERPTARRRRKRSHADDGDDNQMLSKDSESEERVAKDLVDEMQESPLVTNGAQRYPSDVYQALLTQTVYLLERGIVLLSDDGSFVAVANPSSASRIGNALTGNNFAKNFHRYDNDVLPQDLKQKVIERAALVAREHQDRVLEGMVERPIFTLSEIRHYDCNGDYIMKDVSSPNTPVYPFTGIQPTPVYQGFVNPFLTGMTPQGLLTADMHTSFQMLQQYEYINDIGMVDVDELYMDIDESIDDMFMECDDQEDCPYCSQISLSLFASLPTKYAIRKRAIYSLLDKKPLNPEIQSWKINQGTKKSWFAYNSFSFRPEFDQPLGGLSPKDRVIYSLLDERHLNPALAPSLAIQDKSKSWFAYNAFSFREGDLVPVGSNCDCMQTTTAVESWSKPKQVANPVFPCTSEENIATTKPPLNTFSFRAENHSCQQASIFGGSKQESVFSFGKAEPPVPPTEPETISSGISWKDFSFREKDDSQTEVENSGEKDLQSPDIPWKPETQPVTKTSPEISWKDFSFREEDDPLLQAEADKSYETKQQPNDLSLEPVEKQSVKKETLAFSCEQGEETTFPVSEDSDATSSEAESHDEDLFDLNDENEEQTIKEIIAAVKSKLDESRMYYPPQEDVARVSSKGESVKADETASEEEPVNKQAVADGQANLEAEGDEDKTLKDGTAPRKETHQVSKDPPQAAKHEKTSSLESREPASKLTISHSKSINKRSEPYPTQAVSGLAAFMRRRVKMVERGRLKTLQVLTQGTLEHKDADSSGSVPALPADNAQQRKDVSLKSMTRNTKTKSSNKPNLAITVAPSDAEKRKVVSWKSKTANKQTRSFSKSDLAITIGASDEEERQVISSKILAQDKKADLSTAPSVQSDVNSSNKKISLKSLTQTKKKEADVKGSEMERLKLRHQIKNADLLSKPTPTKSAGLNTLNNKKVSFSRCERTEREASIPQSVPSDGEKRGKVVSLKSVIQSKKVDPIIKSSSSESQAEIKETSSKSLHEAEKEEQTSEPTPKEGSSQPAPLKPMPLTSSPKADSMSNPVPRLPLVISDAEHNEVVSWNPLSEDKNTEGRSNMTHPADFASSSVQKTKVVSLTKSLTQSASKKDERELDKFLASVLQAASSVNESKESCDVVKDDVDLSKPSTQYKKMNSLKENAAYAGQSTKHDLVKAVEQSKTADTPKGFISSKAISAVKVEESRMVSLKSLIRGNKPAAASSPASTAAESRAKKASFKSTDDKEKKRESQKSFSPAVHVCAKKTAKVDKETTSGDSLLPKTNNVRKFTFGTNNVMPKPVSCIRNVNVVYLKSVAQTSSVQMHGSTKEVELTSTTPQKEDQTKSSSSTKLVKIPANVVPLRSVSQDEKDGPLSKPSSSTSPSSSNEQVNQLKMSSKSVTKREWAVPARKSSDPVKISVPLMEACAVTPKADVKIDGSAKKNDHPHPVVSQPSSSEKRKTFESLTSAHKRELDEMLEEDRQSDKERMRNFTSRAGKKSSGKTTRKGKVQPKSVSNYNSGDGDRKNTSEADKDVKLVKTDVVQDTSVTKGSPVTKKELQPISITVDVNKVKDAKNESTPQRVPTTLKEAKPSPERRVAVTDVSNSDITLSRQGTSQQSSLTSLAAVGTDGVGVCGGSAVQLSPRPLPPAEASEGIVTSTLDTVNVLQSSPNTAPTTSDPSPVNDPETVSEDACNMPGSAVQTKDTSETPCLPEPQQSASMNLVKEPFCLAEGVAISGDNQTNPKKIPVPQPAAENITPAGKRKLQDMQQEEDAKIPSLAEEKPVEVRKKRCWRTEEPPLNQEEQPKKPRRRIVRNMFKKG